MHAEDILKHLQPIMHFTDLQKVNNSLFKGEADEMGLLSSKIASILNLH